MKKTLSYKNARFILETVLAAAGVMAFTTLILWMAGAPPFKAYQHILLGAFGSIIKVSHVITAWIPLTLCACGLLFTFRIGLWNIGVEGQVMMGAVCSTWMLRAESLPPFIALILAFAAGVLGGGLWAFLAGYLKNKAGVNEIFAGLGLNFVAQGLILWLIFGPWKRPGIASMSGTELFSQALWLPNVTSMRLSPVSLTLAIGAIILTAFLLNRSRLGLFLKAIGHNQQAAFLYNLKPDSYMLLAMMCAGGFAGLAGYLQVTGVYHRLLPSISSSYGYLALLVVMLARYNIWLVPPTAFFFASLNVGSIQLPMMLQLDSSLSGVIQGILVLTVMVVNHLHYRRKVTPKGLG